VIKDLQLVLNQNELDELSESLKVAFDHHLEWLSELNYSMICKQERLSSFCCNDKPHRQCKFGQWYYSIEHSCINQHQDFIAIGKAHKALHQSVCCLVESFAKNGRPTTPIYKKFKQAENYFLELFKALVHSSLEANVNTDFLTGLPNRQALDIILKNEHAKILRDHSESSLVILDIDLFKPINDTFGHVAGDKVLKIIANILNSNVRDCDFLARYGGEEFIIYFPNADCETTASIAEKLRQCIEDEKITIKGHDSFYVTCSFGVSSFIEKHTIKESILNADQAMYSAKSSGRNKVAVSEK
jgi:diguanylate cyclase (GGDEF)-like protein